MSKVLQARTMQKIDTSENWAKATSFVPLKGEICVYSDTNQMKIGDGITPIGNLKFGSSSIYYIEGTGTNPDSTNSKWVGTYPGLTTYYPGLMIAYKIGNAGDTTTTLNLNDLGEIKVVKNNNTGISTSYGVGSIVILVYTVDSDGTAYWKVADYDTNTAVRIYRNNGTGNYPVLFSYLNNTKIGNSSATSYAGNYAKIPHNATLQAHMNMANGRFSVYDLQVRNGSINTNGASIPLVLNPNVTVAGNLNVNGATTLTGAVGGAGFNAAVQNFVNQGLAAHGALDEIKEYTNKASFPPTGENDKIYVDLNTNKIYRWGGTAYVEISSSLALGSTNSTAARGDHKHTATFSGTQQTTSVSYTPAGTISAINHSHTGSVSATFNGTAGTTNTVSFTPAGTVTVTNNLAIADHGHSFTGTAGTTGNASITPKGNVTVNSTLKTSNHTHSFTGTAGNTEEVLTAPKGIVTVTNTLAVADHGHTFTGAAGSTNNVSITPAGNVTINSTLKTDSHAHTFNGTAVTPKFTGTAGTTGNKQPTLSGSITGTFAGTAVTPSFTGTLGNTGNTQPALSGSITGTFTGTAATATASYTPAGTINAPGFTKKNVSVVTGITNGSAALTDNYNATTKTLTIGLNYVSAKASGTAGVLRNNSSIGAPTFTGTAATISSSYTPTGSITITHNLAVANHNHSFTPAGTINSITPAGSITITHNLAVANHNHSFTPAGTINSITPAGTINTVGNILNGAVTATFTGTASSHQHSYTPAGTINNANTPITGNINAIFTGTAQSHKHSYTPAGSINTVTNILSGSVTATFTGTAENHTHSFTPAGTINTVNTPITGTIGATFAGTQINHSHSYTPAGSISGSISINNYNNTPKFTGTAANINHTFTPAGTITVSEPT